MEGHWERVKDKLDRQFYKSPRLGYRTRELFGAALDDFNTDYEELDSKKDEVERVIKNIPDKEVRDKLYASMTASTASSYDKLRAAVIHERELLYKDRNVNSVYDSFLPAETKASPPKQLSTRSVFEDDEYRQAVALIDRLQSKSG